MGDLGVGEETVTRLLDESIADPGWRPLATLDAATRMMASIVGAGGLVAGEEAAGVLERFYRLTKSPPRFTRYALRTVRANSAFCYAKAQRELGYTPRPLPETITDTIDWWRELH